jgi:hypothetical protein
MRLFSVPRLCVLLTALVIVLFAAALYVMGQPLICACDFVKLWHGVVVSSENSQHVSDWYTFSHVIHGFVFYWILLLVSRKLPMSRTLRLLLAVFVEVSWELFENTDFIINRYRETTISLDYYGDSIINSVFDVLFMIVGFVMAYRLPTSVVIVLALLMEIVVGISIRDNLTLNVIMLLYPFEFIKTWQLGGHILDTASLA